MFKHCPQWKSQQKTLWTTVLEETEKLPGPTRVRDRTEIAELFADERCSWTILDFLATQTSERRQAHRWKKRERIRRGHEASEWEETVEGGGGETWRRIAVFPSVTHYFLLSFLVFTITHLLGDSKREAPT